MNFTKKVAFRENRIVNSYVSVALLQYVIYWLANRFVKIKSQMFTKIVIREILLS